MSRAGREAQEWAEKRRRQVERAKAIRMERLSRAKSANSTNSASDYSPQSSSFSNDSKESPIGKTRHPNDGSPFSINSGKYSDNFSGNTKKNGPYSPVPPPPFATDDASSSNVNGNDSNSMGDNSNYSNDNNNNNGNGNGDHQGDYPKRQISSGRRANSNNGGGGGNRAPSPSNHPVNIVRTLRSGSSEFSPLDFPNSNNNNNHNNNNSSISDSNNAGHVHVHAASSKYAFGDSNDGNDKGFYNNNHHHHHHNNNNNNNNNNNSGYEGGESHGGVPASLIMAVFDLDDRSAKRVLLQVTHAACCKRFRVELERALNATPESGTSNKTTASTGGRRRRRPNNGNANNNNNNNNNNADINNSGGNARNRSKKPEWDFSGPDDAVEELEKMHEKQIETLDNMYNNSNGNNVNDSTGRSKSAGKSQSVRRTDSPNSVDEGNAGKSDAGRPPTHRQTKSAPRRQRNANANANGNGNGNNANASNSNNSNEEGTANAPPYRSSSPPIRTAHTERYLPEWEGATDEKVIKDAFNDPVAMNNGNENGNENGKSSRNKNTNSNSSHVGDDTNSTKKKQPSAPVAPATTTSSPSVDFDEIPIGGAKSGDIYANAVDDASAFGGKVNTGFNQPHGAANNMNNMNNMNNANNANNPFGDSSNAYETGGSSTGRVPCSICGRSFNPDRIKKHEDACKKAATKKRKAFDVSKMRAEGTELAEFAQKKPGGGGRSAMGGRGGRNGNSKGNSNSNGNNAREIKKRSKWREQHEQFISSIRAAREYSKQVKAGVDPKDIPPPAPSAPDPTLVQCEYCQRRFNPETAERHIPRCKNTRNRPRPPGKVSARKK